ncbi:MFS transporter [Schauerella aestuarii]|uniref:MFS transporter n=1 Tax=Schauerella aestuarii TaxID=2511204 RepID=UPI001926C390|nr:MFS transporter [Achromobacter aestuarii]
MPSSLSPHASTRPPRHPILAVTLASLIVLVLAQALIGSLSLAALNRLMAQTTADRIEVTARSLGAEIQNGLRLGKPLAQFFGLDDILRKSSTGDHPPSLQVVQVDGTVLAKRQGDGRADIGGDAQALLAALALPPTRGHSPPPDSRETPVRLPSGTAMIARDQSVTIAAPLMNTAGQLTGAIIVDVERNALAWRELVVRNTTVLILVTACGGLLLAVGFRLFAPYGGSTAGSRARFIVPLVAILLAQGLYAAYTISNFRTVWLQVTRENANMLAEGMQRDLNRVLGYGLTVSKLRGLEAPFTRLQTSFPAIGQIAVTDAEGKVLAVSRLPDMPNPGLDLRPDLTFSLPLNDANPAQSAGQLSITLNAAIIDDGVRNRVIDALTVSAVALITAMEMLMLLSLLMITGTLPTRRAADEILKQDDRGQAALVGRLARPVMFSFLFAWALPLGFLPVYARTLPPGALDLPPNLLLALPISVEMACGLIAALLAGRLTDRRGWQTPVIAGLGVAAAGMLACALASTLLGFVAARGLVGFGYGLAWMGLQGFIVTRSAPQARGRNMTSVIAGLFAGHLSGAAVGSMLMEQTGYHTVFVVGATMLILPLSGVWFLLRPYMTGPLAAKAGAVPAASAPSAAEAGAAASATAVAPAPPVARAPALAAPPHRLAETIRLVFTRDFGMLLAGSIVPFSIAQVGLISFALPLYLESQGAAASSVGRILMLYGLCVIYVGPIMGRIADRSASKKRWIVVGGMIGSLGLMALYLNSGMLAAAAAVLLLALASCASGASQSPYMLGLPHVQAYGAAGATSVMRAADKLGQMAGPLIVGGLFGVVGMGTGLAATGAIYLCATLAFWAFAPAGAPKKETLT